MNGGITRQHMKGMFVGSILAAVFFTTPVPAQTARVPLPLRQTDAVYDQFLAAPLSQERMDLVHVLSATGGVIYPPQMNGQPHPENPVIFTTSIGVGVPDEMAGCFATSIIPRPKFPFFVRVYNAPTLDEATFYEDSSIHTPADTVDVAFYPTLTATTNAIDTGDYDADGINNSWERALGLNMSQQDTDGDGVNDATEIEMGTDPLNANSVLPPFMLGAGGPYTLVADWDPHATPDYNAPAPLLQSLSSAIQTTSDPYANLIFSLQVADALPGPWYNVTSGMVGDWPAQLEAPETTNSLQYYRLMIRVKE